MLFSLWGYIRIHDVTHRKGNAWGSSGSPATPSRERKWLGRSWGSTNLVPNSFEINDASQHSTFNRKKRDEHPTADSPNGWVLLSMLRMALELSGGNFGISTISTYPNPIWLKKWFWRDLLSLSIAKLKNMTPVTWAWLLGSALLAVAAPSSAGRSWTRPLALSLSPINWSPELSDGLRSFSSIHWTVS